MNEMQMEQLQPGTQKSLLLNQSIQRGNQIKNYYGAHKNFKTQFRNKKFKNVYNQLIHRKPIQEKHFDMYYEDLLASIIKTIQWSFFSKDNFIENIQPYYYFGKKALKDYYNLFLKQKRYIDGYTKVDPAKIHKINYFLSFCIDFSAKISFFLKEEGDFSNAAKILNNCYTLIVSEVLKSSTSNLRLLKKCAQFFLVYITFCVERGMKNKASQIFNNSFTTLMNMVIIINYNFKYTKNKKSKIKQYVKILKLIVKTILCLAIMKQQDYKFTLCHHIIKDLIQLEKMLKIFRPKLVCLSVGLDKLFIYEGKRQKQLQSMCKQYFKISQIQSLTISKPEPVYPYKFSVEMQQFLKKSNINKKNQNKGNQKLFNAFFQKKNPNKIQKQVRFKLTGSQVLNNNKKKTISKVGGSQTAQFFSTISKLQTDQIVKANNSELLIDENLNQFPLQRLWSLEDIKNIGKSYRAISLTQNKVFNQAVPAKRRISQTNIRVVSSKQTFKKDFFQNGEKKNEIAIKMESKIKKKNSKFKQFNFTAKKRSSYLQYDNVQQKVNKWHKQSANIFTELNGKIGKLRQKKNLVQFKCLQAHENSVKLFNKQKSASDLKSQANPTSRKKSQSLKKKLFNKQKLSGINLFRFILSENRKQFNIKKLQLFAIKTEQTDLIKLNWARKSCVPTLPNSQKVEEIKKNHDQASKSIQFFMREYENAIGAKNNKVKQNRILSKFDYQKQSNIKDVSTNLFTSSLKLHAFNNIRLL